ncbi:MAG: alpha/beta hydrolase [Kangiellaceae bacterium]|nr:alpha/beta hydrolase [Kangiellaceae bacterium]
MKIFKILFLFTSLSAGHLSAGVVYTDFPNKINVDQVYVIYSHGLIVEGVDPKPVHPQFGPYEFAAIKNELVKNNEINLIAQQRPENTGIEKYTRQLSVWVMKLTELGVNPKNIILIGFSRGGELTARASSALSSLGINTVLLATCWKGGVHSEEKIKFGGNFLSIYETTDGARSCQQLADRSSELRNFKEIAISTGKGHGAFFTPLKEWLVPLKIWIKSLNH